MSIINVSAQSIVFSDHTSLNLLISDLAEEGALVLSPDGDTATEAKGLAGTVLITRLYQRMQCNLKIVATSPKYAVYKSQVERLAVLNGSMTITDATGASYILSRLRIQNSEVDAVSGLISFTVSGDYIINKDTIL